MEEQSTPDFRSKIRKDILKKHGNISLRTFFNLIPLLLPSSCSMAWTGVVKIEPIQL